VNNEFVVCISHQSAINRDMVGIIGCVMLITIACVVVVFYCQHFRTRTTNKPVLHPTSYLDELVLLLIKNAAPLQYSFDLYKVE
jgi:hypothetical protein